VGAKQKRRTRDATKRDDTAGGLAVSRKTLRFAAKLSQRTNSTLSSRPRGPRHPATPISRRSSEQDHNTSRKLVNPFIELFSSPILFATGLYFPSVLLHNQGYPKVCPNSLNLLNAGDSFAGISSLTSCYLFSRTRDLIASF
jgi:hypothetical protein